MSPLKRDFERGSLSSGENRFSGSILFASVGGNYEPLAELANPAEKRVLRGAPLVKYEGVRLPAGHVLEKLRPEHIPYLLHQLEVAPVGSVCLVARVQ
jgi:hypothetical protein